MEFFNSAVDVLQTLVIALGAGLGIWGGINLMEGYGNDNPGAKVFRGFSSCYPDLNRRPHPYQLIGRVRFFAFGRFCVFFRSTDRTIWHSCVRCLRPLVSPCGSACGSAKMVPLKISTTISKAQYFTHRRFLSVFNCSRRGAGTLGSNF